MGNRCECGYNTAPAMTYPYQEMDYDLNDFEEVAE